jgi:predicted MPP superfamily phosphohydrolase
LGGTYTLLEAGWLSVDARTLSVARLPAAFKNLKVAFLSDLHHGPYTGLTYIQHCAKWTLDWKPDLIVLGGDYVHNDPKYIAPIFEVLKSLRAPLGTFGVLGNHDHWESAKQTRASMADASITDLTNKGVWLDRNGARLRLGGVGDLWEDAQDIQSALGDATANDAALLLSHNPDYAETLQDARVSLMLSGHTHGGQVQLPFIGAPILPSRYGQKYLEGLVQAPKTQVFVSRGVGTISPPVRFRCRPQVHFLTLA